MIFQINLKCKLLFLAYFFLENIVSDLSLYSMQGDIFKILTNRHAYGIFSCQSNSTDNDLQWEGDPRFPPIGTRVRRGPSWPFSNQDSCMPGTIIGYRNGCKYSYIKKNMYLRLSCCKPIFIDYLILF